MREIRRKGRREHRAKRYRGGGSGREEEAVRARVIFLRVRKGDGKGHETGGVTVRERERVAEIREMSGTRMNEKKRGTMCVISRGNR